MAFICAQIHKQLSQMLDHYWLSSLSVLMAIFPGEPGLASFIEFKDDGSGGDKRSYKLQSSHRHQQTNITAD